MYLTGVGSPPLPLEGFDMKVGDEVIAVAKWLPFRLRERVAIIRNILPGFTVVVEFPQEFSYYTLQVDDYVTVKAEVF